MSAIIVLDHIDGDKSNNEDSNLRLLCFNCHGLTTTFGRSGVQPVEIPIDVAKSNMLLNQSDFNRTFSWKIEILTRQATRPDSFSTSLDTVLRGGAPQFLRSRGAYARYRG
jgi:hypothetical protein